jgi:hypothetical protein
MNDGILLNVLDLIDQELTVFFNDRGDVEEMRD